MNQKYIKELCDYDPVTGSFTWKKHRIRNMIGSTVGHISDTGYYRVCIKGTQYAVHRLIWLWMTGNLPVQIDHIDHVRSNNVWANLREVTQTENMYNKGKYKNNATGVVGVCYETRCSKFKAYIKIPSGIKHLGYFDTIEEATTVRKAAEVQYGYHVNHGQ